MAKNLIPEVAKMLGVEIGERFKIDCSLDRNIFFFDELGLKVRNGDAEIIKLPWKPKKGAKYWTFNVFFGSGKWAVNSFVWGDEVFDNAVFKVGWVFRTREEAEAALPAVAKELGVRYEF